MSEWELAGRPRGPRSFSPTGTSCSATPGVLLRSGRRQRRLRVARGGGRVGADADGLALTDRRSAPRAEMRSGGHPSPARGRCGTYKKSAAGGRRRRHECVVRRGRRGGETGHGSGRKCDSSQPSTTSLPSAPSGNRLQPPGNGFCVFEPFFGRWDLRPVATGCNPGGSIKAPSSVVNVGDTTVVGAAGAQPHGALLERAVCVVCHAGMGITQKALAHGVPVVAVPFGRDQPEVARRVEVAHAGVRLPARRLRRRRGFARRSAARSTCSPGAERIAAAFAAAGGPNAAADALETLVLANPQAQPLAGP